MKKIILLFSFLLSGCLFPSYYTHEQKISFQIPTGSQVEYDGEIINTTNNHVNFSVFRSWFDKEIIIKKQGYKDYHLQLNSEWSSEKWAEWHPLLAASRQESGGLLMLPYNTGFILGHMFEEPPVILCLPVTILLDVYNMLIGGPSTAILNPWKEYKYETQIQMEPLTQNTNTLK